MSEDLRRMAQEDAPSRKDGMLDHRYGARLSGARALATFRTVLTAVGLDLKRQVILAEREKAKVEGELQRLEGERRRLQGILDEKANSVVE